MPLNNKSIILESLQELEATSEAAIPAGYTPIELSTKGKVGAPARFHVRNFKMGDILTLSLTNKPDIPARLIEILNSMIYEDDIDVGTWHESEVEELMLYIFMTYYSSTLESVEFPLEEEDLEFVKTMKDGESLYQDIVQHRWIPKVDIPLGQSVSTYDIADDFKPTITITNKNTGFYVTFGYVQYKDQIQVKRWLDNFFKDQEARFRKLKETIAFNDRISESIKSKEDFDLLDSLLPVDVDEMEEYKKYSSEKLQVLSEILRIVTIVDYNGEDVSKLSLSEKYEKLADDPQIDFGMINALNKKQKDFNIGIKPEVEVINPVTNKPCTRRFSFRIPSILLALQVQGSSQYDDRGYDQDRYELD